MNVKYTYRYTNIDYILIIDNNKYPYRRIKYNQNVNVYS